MTLLLGGARSGKSRLATEMMNRAAGPVGLIATAEALDDEMRVRIDRHRESRPSSWAVVEEPLDLLGAIRSFPTRVPIIIDCLTLWVSNRMGDGSDETAVQADAMEAAEVAAERVGITLVVTNEVGSGIVPANAMARSYRDLLGSVNSIWAERSDRVLLVVAGGVVPVHRAAEMMGGSADG
jgi:adenosyl cobinamide kinase/adenosyl cobinamide phosphate guanylyltransferase